MNSEEMRQMLWLHIKKVHRTGSVAAKHWGYSPAFISGVLNGHKEPTPIILNDLGLVKQTIYVKADNQIKEK